MRASVDPETAVRLLHEEHHAVRKLIDNLTDEEMTRPDTIRYGLYPDQELSFKDLLAHLTTYEAYALEALEAWQNDEKHWISDAMQSAEGSRNVHYGGIEERRLKSLEEMIEEWDQIQLELVETLADLNENEWRSPAPYPTDEPTDLGGMLEAILVAPPRPMYRHLPVHIPDSDTYVQSLRSG